MKDFEEYIRQGEPDKVEKSQIWQTAIGLQQVDGLTPSDYLIETAKQNIEGKITIDEVQYRIDSYYKTKTVRTNDDDRTEEADTVSARIVKILSNDTFSFSPVEYINIHKQLFAGIYKFAGKIRDYNISKAEWALNEKSVLYSGADIIRATLDYDFRQEKDFNYKGLNKREIVEHIAKFVSGLWQIHAFGEGNTRTTAVFTIKYLRSFSFKVENDIFAEHSWYFRNALVRANYNDYANKIYATQEYLMKFFGNLLFGENNELKNRYLKVIIGENTTANSQDIPVNIGEMSEKCRRNVGEISERQKRILEFIADNNTISAKQLAVLLNTSDRTIERDIKKLSDLKYIERTGADRGGFWNIITDK
jgi:fido (protein-threonine AMPylation protein)